MSYRHAFITEFLYRHQEGQSEPIDVREVLEKYASYIKWEGNNESLGYYHGIIKDLNGEDTKQIVEQIKEELSKVNCRIEIIIE